MDEDGEEGPGELSDWGSVSQQSTASGPSVADSASSSSAVPEEEVEKMSIKKTIQVIKAADEGTWRRNIREQMETELERRVREALATPPRERLTRQGLATPSRDDINAHLLLGLTDKEKSGIRAQRWRDLQARKSDIMTYFPSQNAQVEFIFRDELSKSNQDQFPGVFGLDSFSEGIKNIREDYSNIVSRYTSRPKARHFYTKEGFLKSLRQGTLQPGVQLLEESSGRFLDKYGVVRDNDGPFWPVDSVPLFPTPKFKWWTAGLPDEPLYTHLPESLRTVENQATPYTNRWRGTLIVFDSERSPREYSPQPVTEGCCPNLVFESRFESGNLRQARRVGMFEYELILKTDLYTQRHTQWYFFRVSNAVPGVTYKFKVVNLLKSDSLYNYGMRPLVYSEKEAAERQQGWVRTGHHISYTRNTTNLASPLLSRVVPFFMLEWQMEFPQAEDTCYLAHCYPYTFTDLKDDLDSLAASPERRSCLRREVLCETRAGNSCFLLTVTNFEKKEGKKAVVVTARVHPGESQASWMMKGLLEFLTSSDPVAQELRDLFVFKLVPMLNPDGVIVGNYRCSLAARDLNRNYRHPRRENFPTIVAVKQMMEELMQTHEIMLYCDLHGHSRKHNVFMYGNNTSADGETDVGAARAFIAERLFPWLMATTCPDKFAFRSCKFQIRRCKESTGRVVMWRQMNVHNSFTLEATFSGTTLNRDKCRHFNLLDLMDVGRSLARAVLDYHQIQEDKLRQTQTVLELTRAITQQILESRGLLGPDSVLPELAFDRNLMELDAQAVQEEAEKWTGALLNLLQPPLRPQAATSAPAEPAGRKGGAATAGPLLSKEEALRLLERATEATVDSCFSVLAALNVREALQESDSSDSDSESEPEMKPPEPKPRKKKRKSRKQRDRELHDNKKSSSDRRADEREKELRGKAYSGGASSVLDRLNKERRASQFQSKYEGRHNGGVPCFTEERSLERAAKRVAEMKKKYEDDRQREISVVCLEEQALYGYPTPLYPQEELNHRLQLALSEGTANLSRTLMGINVRTSYTHADSLQDMHSSPSINGNFMLATHLSSFHGNHSPAQSNGRAGSGGGKPPVKEEHENSSSEDSDSEGEGGVRSQLGTAAVPLAARKSPYFLHLLQRAPTLTSWPVRTATVPGGLGAGLGGAAGAPGGGGYHPSPLSVVPSATVAKRPVRYRTGHVTGSSKHALQRHSPGAQPPIMASSIQPISREPARQGEIGVNADGKAAAPKAEKSPYDNSSSGSLRRPLIRGLRHPTNGLRQSQSYGWE